MKKQSPIAIILFIVLAISLINSSFLLLNSVVLTLTLFFSITIPAAKTAKVAPVNIMSQASQAGNLNGEMPSIHLIKDL